MPIGARHVAMIPYAMQAKQRIMKPFTGDGNYAILVSDTCPASAGFFSESAMLKLVAQNTEEQIEAYRIDNETVDLTCAHCGHEDEWPIKYIKDAFCRVCNRRKWRFQY